MACPHFRPRGPLLSWVNPPRVSLVEPCDGVCSRTGARPAEEILRESCNAGYARGRCALISEDDPDAVCFTISGGGEVLRQVRFILEREHAPVETGWAVDAPPGSPLEAQAKAFLAAWRRRSRLHAR
mgnify:CR=1 FL=1